MPTGIDSFTPVPAPVVAAAGHSFVIRYLTDLDSPLGHKAKAWTVAQIAACRAAGLGVVAVWQGGYADRTFAWREGYDRGRRDARLAAQQATALGRPEGRPVYFAIDKDVMAKELPLVAEYFRGIASVFDVRNIGVYGGRRVVEWAMSAGAAAWFWQTGAWSSGKAAGIHLYQRIPPTRLGQYEVDIDDSSAADYGQWFDAPGGAMAWYPGATRRELQPESRDQPAIRPTQLILHSIAAPWSGQRMYEYWRDSTNLESHFGLSYDGGMFQFIGTQTRADANASANRRADGTGAVSVETASNLEHTDPWTDAQLDALIRLGAWMHHQHELPLRVCRSWDDPGYGYHRLHAKWAVSGTACPGNARVAQFNRDVFPGIVSAARGGVALPTTPLEPDVELNDGVTNLDGDEPGVTEGGFAGTEIVVRDSLNAANLVQLAVKHVVLPALAGLQAGSFLHAPMPEYARLAPTTPGEEGYLPTVGECINGAKSAASVSDVAALAAQVTALDAKVSVPTPVEVTPEVLAAALDAAVAARVDDIAEAVVAKLGQRMEA